MNPLYLAVTGAVIAAVALFLAVAALLKRARLDPLATLAVAAEHRLRLPAGELVLHLAGPFGKRGLGELSFRLVDSAGNAVPSSPLVVRTRRSTASGSVLLAVRRFVVSAEGAYRLVVTGIAADRDLSDCRIVLAPPQGPGLVIAILGVVAAAVALVVCSVLTLIVWLSPSALSGLQGGLLQ
jgi:hypothetical protein